MKKLCSFDVTLKELESLRGDEKGGLLFSRSEKEEELAPPSNRSLIMDILKMLWMGNPPTIASHWDEIRVGTVYAYLDDDRCLHLDFQTRFTVEAEIEKVFIKD